MTDRSVALALAVFALAAFGAAPARAAAPPGWVELPNSPSPSPSVQRHDDLHFIDTNRGWLVNGDGDVWHTPDSGNSWQFLTNTTVYNRCVGFADSLHGWIGTLFQLNGDALEVTSDGGQNWSVVSLPNPKPRGICGLCVVDPSVVVGVGAYYGFPRFIRTVDGGANWSVLDMTPYCGALVDVYFWHPDSGLACGSTAPGSTRKPRLLSTTDGGATWNIVWTGTRNRELLWKIHFVDRTTGFVAIENLGTTGAAYFLKTKDGGLTWTEMLFQPTYFDCEGIGFLTEEIGWIGGWNFQAYGTLDGGDTWSLGEGFGWNVNRFRFLSPTLAFACGERVYKYVGDVSGVADGAPPPERLLAQNRPNPFGAATTIHYALPEGGPVTLQLFDLQGRLLRLLEDGVRPAGEHSVTIDAAALAAGEYLYRLTTSRGVETRKLSVVR